MNHHGDLRASLLTTGMRMREPGELFSLRAVAREARVSPTAPYRHFTDRDALENACRLPLRSTASCGRRHRGCSRMPTPMRSPRRDGLWPTGWPICTSMAHLPRARPRRSPAEYGRPSPRSSVRQLHPPHPAPERAPNERATSDTAHRARRTSDQRGTRRARWPGGADRAVSTSLDTARSEHEPGARHEPDRASEVAGISEERNQAHPRRSHAPVCGVRRRT